MPAKNALTKSVTATVFASLAGSAACRINRPLPSRVNRDGAPPCSTLHRVPYRSLPVGGSGTAIFTYCSVHPMKSERITSLLFAGMLRNAIVSIPE